MFLVAAKFYFSDVTELQRDSHGILVVYETLKTLSEETLYKKLAGVGES
jgi:hypothetical protein